MCGIAGIIGRAAPRMGAALERSLISIAHRGPDGQGIWRDQLAHLGHRRLAILDLSDAGAQPMVDRESGMVIVFNGEIYNHLDIRADLEAKGHVFSSGSDTETLLKGYVEWGQDVLARCNGMWAFVVWDPKTGRAFAARDRFGVKPFYYSLKKGTFAFASEPKALHALDPTLASADATHIVDLIVDSRMHVGTQTFFRGILALSPGHAATYDVECDHLTVWRYWDYSRQSTAIASVDDEDAEFAELLEDAVRLRFRSDVSVGMTLSGGLDSSAILAAAVGQGNAPAGVYTSVYSAALRGELSWAEKAAAYAGMSVDPVESAIDDWPARIEQVVHHMDSPGYSPAVLPLWSIMERARNEGVPVLLEGQGADELLGGYPQYMAAAAVGSLRSGDLLGFAAMARGLRTMSTSSWAAAWLARTAFPRASARMTREPRMRLINPDLLRCWLQRGPLEPTSPEPSGGESGQIHGEDSVLRALWRDHSSNILPALLHYGDAISMAHGIESRLPFMDYRLVDWVFSRRPNLLRAGASKAPVRRYLATRGFPAIAARADKLGYPVPMLDWWKRAGEQSLNDSLADSGAVIWNVFERNEVRKLATAAGSGSQRHLFHIYKIVSTHIWLRQLATREQASKFPAKTNQLAS